MSVTGKFAMAEIFVDGGEFRSEAERGAELFHRLLEDKDCYPGVKGWMDVAASAVQLDEIKVKAAEIRAKADVFVLVGVGGSNQAARGVIKALGGNGPEILYAGNSLSAHYLSQIMKKLEGKSVYINVIAKNFATLEPGSHFRVLRQWMEKQYSGDELATRIVVTGTLGSRLEEISKEKGYLFLQFPVEVGGRYSAFTPVGLLPIAVAGLDIDQYLAGGIDMAAAIREHSADSAAIQYAALRSLLYKKGIMVEQLVSFEPRLAYLTKWWIQLFGESEGKDKKGMFPSGAIYSEDLHSMGQYMQDGLRILMETFIEVENPDASLVIHPDKAFGDEFDYLDGQDFADINKAAQQATQEAHTAGGVPCVCLKADRISEYTLGELYYLFMAACSVSGQLIGVNPFDQEGVEEYKNSMFRSLGR
ncbi:MAG: glucose-6-phosphate isomerase [Angelakisella sp.]